LNPAIVIGSFTTFITLPIVTYILGYPIVFTLMSIFLTILVFYLHRANIQRIINKEELKISTVIKRR